MIKETTLHLQHSFARPITILFLTLPYGISAGFVSVTLPFVLVQQGFSVATAAAITAVGVSSNIWRFVWAPLTDLTLSLHKWYRIGISLCVLSLLALLLIPTKVTHSGALMVVVFISQVAATFVAAPVGGFMAKVIEEEKKGRAAGFFQAGYLGGMGIGGGAGIWLTTHFSYNFSCIAISIAILLCAFALYFVPKVDSDKAQTIRQGFQSMLLGVKDLIRSPVALFTIAVLVSPVASGGASYLWSAVAPDWKVPDNTVALVTGVLSGLASTLGCLIGGFVSDKLGRWWAYFGGGLLMAVVTTLLYLSPFVPFSYISGVLIYALLTGVANAAFSAAILRAIGTHLAASKYALLSSLGNIPVVYMTAFNGYLHDEMNVKAMLVGESILGVFFIVLLLLAKNGFKVNDKPLDAVTHKTLSLGN